MIIYLIGLVLCLSIVVFNPIPGEHYLTLCMHYYTVKVWLFRDIGSSHCPETRFISRDAAEGNKHGQGAMETACIPK